jgi:hypothetical protein
MGLEPQRLQPIHVVLFFLLHYKPKILCVPWINALAVFRNILTVNDCAVFNLRILHKGPPIQE